MEHVRRVTMAMAVVLLCVFLGGLPALAGEGGKVSLNKDSAEVLAKIPGVSPELAKAIVEQRTKSGPFKKLEDVLKTPGMSLEIFNKIGPQIDSKGDVVCPAGNEEQEEVPTLAPSKC